jgi:hypothetical protein
MPRRGSSISNPMTSRAPARSRKRLVEDAVRVRACELRLLPSAMHRDVLIDGKKDPVMYNWSTNGHRGTVHLTVGRCSGNFQVVGRRNNFGLVWWFVVDGKLLRQVFCVLDPVTGTGEWGSAKELDLDWACHRLGRRSRLRRERRELVKARMELEEDRKVARWKEINERLDAIKEELV